MQGTKGPDVLALVFLSSVIWHWLTGFLRNKQPLRRGLQYNLCMMGIPLTGPSFIYADNKSQVTNSTRPELTLKKKCNSMCYHVVWESVAMGESLITHINYEENLSDLMTKVTHGSKCRQLVGNILCNLYDHRPKQWGKSSRSRPTDLEGTEEIIP
jgi:hypothetical protein